MADMKTIQCRILTCAVRNPSPAFLDEHLIADHEYQSCNLCGSAQAIRNLYRHQQTKKCRDGARKAKQGGKVDAGLRVEVDHGVIGMLL